MHPKENVSIKKRKKKKKTIEYRYKGKPGARWSRLDIHTDSRKKRASKNRKRVNITNHEFPGTKQKHSKVKEEKERKKGRRQADRSWYQAKCKTQWNDDRTRSTRGGDTNRCGQQEFGRECNEREERKRKEKSENNRHNRNQAQTPTTDIATAPSTTAAHAAVLRRPVNFS